MEEKESFSGEKQGNIYLYIYILYICCWFFSSYSIILHRSNNTNNDMDNILIAVERKMISLVRTTTPPSVGPFILESYPIL